MEQRSVVSDKLSVLTPALHMGGVCIGSSAKVVAGQQGAVPFGMDLYNGEVGLVIGLNNSGKSRLLSAAAGVVRLRESDIQVGGFEPKQDEFRCLLGYVPSQLGLCEELTCGQYLELFAASYGVERHYEPYLIREALALVRLQDCLERPIAELDDPYQRVRLSLARALVHDPLIVIIDDVFRHVGVHEQRFWLEILGNVRNRGKALLLSSDQLDGLEKLANQIAYLHRGNVYLLGSAAAMAVEVSNHFLFQIQLLDARNAKTCLQYLGKFPNIYGLEQSPQDPSLLRLFFRGQNGEFDAILASLRRSGAQIVSCWEDTAFFGHKIP